MYQPRRRLPRQLYLTLPRRLRRHLLRRSLRRLLPLRQDRLLWLHRQALRHLSHRLLLQQFQQLRPLPPHLPPRVRFRRHPHLFRPSLERDNDATTV